MKTASQVLREARALIGTPEKWASCFEETMDGSGRLCAVQAIVKIRYGLDTPAERYLKRAMGVQFVHVFNDSHAHSEVLQAYDRAIALAEKDEAPQRKPRESDSDYAARMVREITAVVPSQGAAQRSQDVTMAK